MRKTKRARPPAWWIKLVSSLPKFSLPLLEPKVWTQELAQAWVDWIPAKCPFERAVWWHDRLVLYIPPLCPINPFSTQLYTIRSKAQEFLYNFKDETSFIN
jgi:hypothetical protein